MSKNQDEETINRAKEVRKLTWEAFLKKYESKFKKQLSSPSTFVIVASISLFDRVQKAIKIVSIGFGTKSLPYSLIQQNNSEDFLVDMHAQILAIQAFRRFLLKKISENDQQYLQRNEKKGKFKIKDKYSVYLYCSQIFCGDCCINQKQASFSGAKPLKYLQTQKYPELKYEPNVLRTKPGRLDLPVVKRSHLLSCSDKLAFYNLVGIQGPKLFQTLLPVYLDLIIVQSQNTMREYISKGIDFVQRLHQISNKSQKLIERQIFNIVINQQQRKITNQFHRNIPSVIVLQKGSKHNRDQEGFQLCGIISQQAEEWINGKTGLPEGSSLKNYKNKGKTSLFCEAKMKACFENYKQGDDYFKYEAIEYRLKKLFRQWISPE